MESDNLETGEEANQNDNLTITLSDTEEAEIMVESGDEGDDADGDADYVCSGESNDEDDRENSVESNREKKSKKAKQRKRRNSDDDDEDFDIGDCPDDNDTKTFKARVNRLPYVEEDFTVTRNVKSANFEDSQLPWKVDTTVWNRLHPYQQDGVRWLQKKSDQRSGGILADEMGLGKTIQAVVYLRSIAETKRPHYKFHPLSSCLIVCNVSVIAQWIKAFHEWFPKCRVFLLHSNSTTGRRNKEYINDILDLFENPSNEIPWGAVFLTTYNFFTINKWLCKKFWQCVILDEGHYIRNDKTKCSQAMQKLICTQRFILTGTPFQNKLSEFWKLVDFVHPGRLSNSSTFHRNFVQIINAGANLRCSPEAAAKAYECLVALHRAVKPLILRRLQEDYKHLLNLPEKDERVYSCELSDRQRRIYEEYLASGQVSLILSGKAISFSGLQKLSNICNHPGIYRGAQIGSKEFGKIKHSGKLEMTFKLFKEWFKDPENRVIFFTQRIAVIKMMEHFLGEKNIKSVSFTGSDTASARQKTINAFESDPTIKVFLITTRAGGLGLNLTHANKVIIFDPDWNPAADNQAKDRCYRIGQTKNVSIVRLISNGTIEDRIYMKQVQKEMLGAQLLHNADVNVSVPNNNMADLFRLKPKGLSGSEIGVYLPGEITKDHQSAGKHNKEKAKKKLKNKLDGFEDKGLLLSLFDDEKLVAMREHSINVQNAATVTRAQKIEIRRAVDSAVASLLHTESRLAHTWKEEFHKRIIFTESDELKKLDYYVEREEIDSYWKQVHSGFTENNDQAELNRVLTIARNIVELLNGMKGAPESFIRNTVMNDKDRENATLMSFFYEVLANVTYYKPDDGKRHLLKRYRDVQFVETRKRRSLSVNRGEDSTRKIAKVSSSSGLPPKSTKAIDPIVIDD